MGYYTGTGVVTGGSNVISLNDTVLSGGTLVRERMTKTVVLVKNGVSLAAVQGATPTCEMRCGDLTCGSYVWPTPQASGNIVNFHYVQIAGSNLYQLVQNTEKFQMRLCAKNGAGVLDKGGWAALP